MSYVPARSTLKTSGGQRLHRSGKGFAPQAVGTATVTTKWGGGSSPQRRVYRRPRTPETAPGNPPRHRGLSHELSGRARPLRSQGCTVPPRRQRTVELRFNRRRAAPLPFRIMRGLSWRLCQCR